MRLKTGCRPREFRWGQRQYACVKRSAPPMGGVSPHTLRRTVGTLVAHTEGLDAVRDALGHRDPSVTARHYVADTSRVIDVVTRWTRSSSDSSLGPAVVSRRSLAVDPNAPTRGR